MSKPTVAFILGSISLPLYFFGADHFVVLVLMAAYFFICEFLLSRRNRVDYRKDWPNMLVLNVVPLLLVGISLLWEESRRGVGILISSFGGTFAGAVVASLAARRKG